jgi:small subunit ribosomal protein S1
VADDDEDFAAMLDASFAEQGKRGVKKLRAGETVKGRIVQIAKEAVFVDVGTRSEGEIERRQLEDRDGQLTVSVGDEVTATVQTGGDRPVLVVSFGRGGMNTAALELAAQAGTPVEGVFQNAVKAGLEVDMGGTRAFCPASQVDTAYVADLSIWEGQRYLFKVLEVRDGGRSVIVSRKAVLMDERAAAGAEVLSNLQPGAEVEGTVTAIKNFGAFVDIGGVEGMVHISELGHGRVATVQDVVSVGEKVSVRVLAIEGERIKLSMRQVGAPPAADAKSEKIVDGTVTNVEGYGVFVSTEAGVGLVPTKELSLAPGADAKRSYPVGKEVRVVLLGTDTSGKLRLSIRRVEDAEARAQYREFRGKQKQKKSGGVGSLGELLKARLGDIEVSDASAATPAAAPAGAPTPTEPAKPKKGKRRRI